MITRRCIVIQPDIIVLFSPNRDNGSFQCQFLSLETSRAMHKPAPGDIHTKDEGRRCTWLTPGKRGYASASVAISGAFTRTVLARNMDRCMRVTRLCEETVDGSETQWK